MLYAWKTSSYYFVFLCFAFQEALHHKGILKHERNYPNKHVDFDLALQYIPFDPKKDYTIDIQFVETIKKRVVSYAALYAQKKEEEEETVQAAAAAALQEPTSAATDEHTKLMDAADTNGVSVKSEWIIIFNGGGKKLCTKSNQESIASF